LMPLFLSCRAAIRAKTNATALAVQTDSARGRELQTSAREYLAMAERLLHPPPTCLVAIGGLSGSGKTTIATALAPFVGAVPGAIVLRSDEIRKQICGVPMLSRLGPEGYTTEITNRVYETFVERAGETVRGGFTAIVDATFLRSGDRQAIEALARAAAVPLVGLWLEGPLETLLERLRRRQHDASDADATVLRRQYAQDAGAVSWHRLNTSSSIDAVRDRALALFRIHLNDATIKPTHPQWSSTGLHARSRPNGSPLRDSVWTAHNQRPSRRTHVDVSVASSDTGFPSTVSSSCTLYATIATSSSSGCT
jgi:uncharacterized protein